MLQNKYGIPNFGLHFSLKNFHSGGLGIKKAALLFLMQKYCLTSVSEKTAKM